MSLIQTRKGGVLTRVRRVRRSWAAVATISVAASFAIHAGPTQAVDPFTIPAGLGCAFDVEMSPLLKQGPAAARLPIGFADITLTNLETGASIVTKSRYTEAESYDAVNGAVAVTFHGRVWVQFYPGDQGPDGVVPYPGAMLRLVGNTSLTWDLDDDTYTAFAFDGQATDLCALLATT